MDSEPRLISTEAFDSSPRQDASNPETPAETSQAPALTGFRLWAERVFLVVYVVFCIELGILLAVLPWTRIWTDNNLVAFYPWLRAIALDNFVRGVVTGVGIVDIWLGIWEAVRYRESNSAPASPGPA